MASQSPLKKYTSYLVYTGVALAVLSSFGYYFWTKNIHGLWFIILLFIGGMQWLSMAFVMKFAQHKAQTLLKQYQIAKMAKLFIFVLVLAAYTFLTEDKTDVFKFLTNFIAYYFVFFVLEAWFFQRWANALPKTPERNL